VIEFYHKAFCVDSRAREYLIGRGITDNALFAAHGVGFANGTLLNVLPDDGDVTAALKDIGILNEREASGDGVHLFINLPFFLSLRGGRRGTFGGLSDNPRYYVRF
jgi:hypothetical protein